MSDGAVTAFIVATVAFIILFFVTLIAFFAITTTTNQFTVVDGLCYRDRHVAHIGITTTRERVLALPANCGLA